MGLLCGCEIEENEAQALLCNAGIELAQGQKIGDFDGFVAYYTRLAVPDRSYASYGLENLPISGPFADIVVNIGRDRRVEFGRGTSYHPVWVIGERRATLPRIVDVHGDGDEVRPDRLNRYVSARIVDADAERALIHLRYVRDFSDPTPTGVVHELFEVHADGSVVREARIGTAELESYGMPANNPMQRLWLGPDGIEVVENGTVDRTGRVSALLPAPTADPPVAGAVAAFRLDDGAADPGREAVDAVSGVAAHVRGHAALWRTGVSGTALEFDGYTSDVLVPAPRVPVLSDAFTLEAWVAVAAYPFGIAPIVGRADSDGAYAYRVDPDDVEIWCEEERLFDPEEDEVPTPVLDLRADGRGYLLGLDETGSVVLMADIGGSWQEVASASSLPLRRWTHVVGTYDSAGSKLQIYLDGVLDTESDVTGTGLAVPDELDLVIGRNAVPQVLVGDWCMSPAAVKESMFGIEGLVDEVRIYDRALGPDEVEEAFAALEGGATTPDLPARGLPQPSVSARFGAQHTTLSYHPSWDALWRSSGVDDVVVGFADMPTKIAFWRGTSYGPAWIGDTNKWFVDQSSEWVDATGLAEHMSDKQVRYSHVRVLENSSARVVVHWRYAVSGLTYEFVDEVGELAWIDELYTIYPDGLTVRAVQDWFCNATHPTEDRFGWQGTGFLAEEGTTPLDTIHQRAAIVLNSAGQRVELDAVGGTDPTKFLSDGNLVWLDMRAEYKVFMGFPEGVQLEYFHDVVGEPWNPEEAPLSPFQTFNHWPVSQLPSDGRTAVVTDRITSSEGIVFATNLTALGDVALYGFTRNGPDDLQPIVRGWNHPPHIADVRGAAEAHHDRRQHALVFTGGSGAVSFVLDPAEGSPVIRPAIVVQGWAGPETPVVELDGVALPPTAVRSGLHHNGGVRTLVLWLDVQLTTRTPVEIR